MNKKKRREDKSSPRAGRGERETRRARPHTCARAYQPLEELGHLSTRASRAGCCMHDERSNGERQTNTKAPVYSQIHTRSTSNTEASQQHLLLYTTHLLYELSPFAVLNTHTCTVHAISNVLQVHSKQCTPTKYIPGTSSV